MLTSVHSQDQTAAVRLVELLSDRSAWHRSLWGIGTVLAMAEMVEACAAMRQGHLSEAALKRMGSTLQKRSGQHPAFSDDEKHFLRQQLQQVPRPDSAAHYGIRELGERLSSDYLQRWGRVVALGSHGAEHFARSVASHLLDAGFTQHHVRALVKQQLDADQPISLADLCEILHAEACNSPLRDFDVLVAFSAPPLFRNAAPPGWLQGVAVMEWLKEHHFDTGGVRAPAAVLLKVRARDTMGAAQAAREESDRYAARMLLATSRPLRRLPSLWIKGADAPIPLEDASRGVLVKELYREDRVFRGDANPSVEAALELLAHLEGSSAPAAVAGGWGAIEGLLADPSDRASAADNLATLVTCSYPRAELTRLSYRVQPELMQAWDRFDGPHANRLRCRELARHIADDTLAEPLSLTDRAAVIRMQKVLNDPRPQLQVVRDAIGDSLHRLYRQRNLILHGARLDSVALSASLRTVSKLVGAGMDRITHGQYVQNVKPLELVAKANLALALINRDSALGCVDLLESA
ncbi:integrase [Achromobacter sp. GG226]|uniref:integrase n=1 Tax=Verticiella alkaliphila TaxID=2779529 RepID=UPI001C0C3399|nr:integrase [Verticiella sp. GG226]MBU4611986.1 integrase [Verticiella sp. GG226]